MILNITPTDGSVAFYFDSGYTQATGNYSEGGSLYLQVTDGDQNFSSDTVDTVIVKVTNVTTGEIENVTLDETGVNTGVFRKALVTTTSASDAGNNSGVLKASLGDSIKVEYTDPITGTTTDNPANPGITSPYTSGNANADTSAVVKIKMLYFSADALSGDGTGDLDRIDPANASPLDTITDSTYVLINNSISSATPILSVSGDTAGTAQSIASTFNIVGQSFIMLGTKIGNIALDLKDRSTPVNTGYIFAYLRSSWYGTNLATASIDASVLTSSYAYTTFNFADVTVTSGVPYYIVLENQSSDLTGGSYPNHIAWHSGNGYTNGTALDSSGIAQNGLDYNFKVFPSDSSSTASVQYVGGNSNTYITGVSTLYAQSFSISGIGTYSVDKVALSLKDTNGAANSGYINVYLRSAINGDNLASASLLASMLTSSYQLVNIDFASNPTLNKGTPYYVVIDNLSSDSVDWEYVPSSTYSGGSYWANSSLSAASYTATTTRDFILNVYDPSGSLITTVPYQQGKQVLNAGQYGGESFVIDGTGSYVLDKVSLNLDNQDASNSGTLTLAVRSGSVIGTVLAQINVNADTLLNSGVLGSVTFDLPNATLNKGTIYYLTLTNGATGSIDWSMSGYDTYSSGQSFVNGTSGSSSADYQFNLYEPTISQVSASFTQSIAMTEPFVLPAGGLIKIISYVSGITGGTPTTGNITAHLTYGSAGSTIANLSAFIYIDSGGGTGVITWIGKVANTVTIATGEAVQLVVTNNQSGLGFAVDYDSNTAPSRIELPTKTLIKVEDISFYDDSYVTGGAIISTVYAGGMVYVRVKVSDPFGSDDVTGVTLSIDGPDSVGDLASVSLTKAHVVAINGAEKTYEYAWRTVNNTGAYNVSVIAKEGYENTITDAGNGSMIVTALDLGTPSKTQFITALNGSDAGDVYVAGSNAFLRVTDLDKNTDPLTKQTVTAVVNGTNVMLTETDVNTGIFEDALTGFTTLAEGAVLSARYVDSNDSSDISADGISVPVAGNEPPAATDNARTINENATATGTSLMSTNEGSGVDADPENNALTVLAVNDNRGAIGTSFTLPSGAVVNVASTGNYTYNPNSAFNYLITGESATDSFSYTITDGNGNTSTATVTVTINGLSDPSVGILYSNIMVGTAGYESVLENGSVSGKTFTIDAPVGLLKITVAGTDVTATQLKNASGSPVNITTTKGVLSITGYTSGTGVVTYSYDPTGSSRDHSGGDNSIIDQIAVTVTDAVGTTSAPNSISMLIADTVSTANADTGSVTEDNATTTVTGILITGTGSATADTLGTDTPTTVVGIVVGTTNADLQSAGTVSADIVGTYGKLNVAADGGYIYTLDNSDTETNALAAGVNANDVFTYTIKDADGDVSHATVTVTVTGANDAPAISGVPATAQAITAGVVATLDDFTVADVDTNTLTVTLTSTNGATGGLTDADTATAGIQLTGTASAINTALAGATFTATAAGAASIGISVTDGVTPTTATYSLTAGTTINAAPTLTDLTAVTFAENTVNATPQFIDSAVTFGDTDSADLNGGVLTVSYSSTGLTEDQLSIQNQGTGQISVTDATVSYENKEFGTITTGGSNGSNLVVSFNTPDATPTAVDALIQALTYKNTSDTPTATRTILMTVSDGDGGTSTAATAVIAVTSENDIPTITAVDQSPMYAEINGPDTMDNDVVINSALTASDLDGTVTSATVIITNVQSSDALVFVDTAKIQGSYDAPTGVLTLRVKSGQSPMTSDFEAALESVKFNNTSDSPDTTSRTIEFKVSDGTAISIAATESVTVTGTNDAAVITGTSKASVTEGDVASDLSTSGTLTSTDVDGTANLFTAQSNVAGSHGYGRFSITTAGAWSYTADSAHNEFVGGTSYTDSITVSAADGTTQLVTVTMTGTNDAAVISGTSTASVTEGNLASDLSTSGTITGTVTEDISVTNNHITTSGTLTIIDPDQNQSSFVAQPTYAGTWGTFTLDAAGNWMYSADNTQATVQQLGVTQSLTDSFTAVSLDGSASQSVTVTINGTTDAFVTVKFRAIFLNGMLGLIDTKYKRLWLGGGIGYGQTKFPDARSATFCGCLQPLTHDDIAFRVKLQAEREISTNAALFAEAGYIKLTGGETQNIPGVDYGALNFTNLALGIRVYL
ncbi:MAG: beta strand repeat-containing protein [Chlorobium sp.]